MWRSSGFFAVQSKSLSWAKPKECGPCTPAPAPFDYVPAQKRRDSAQSLP